MTDFLPVIARTATVYERLPELQEELKQEMAAEAWRALGSFQDLSKASTFLYRVIHNVGANHVRYASRRSVQTVCVEEHAVHLASREPEKTLSRGSLVEAMFRLPVEQRQVMAMKLEGLQNHQIADITGMTQTNIGVMLNRAKTRLNQLLETTYE